MGGTATALRPLKDATPAATRLLECVALIQYHFILGDSPTSHSRSYQLAMLLPCRQQAAPGGQNVIGGPGAFKSGSWLILCTLSPRIS